MRQAERGGLARHEGGLVGRFRPQAVIDGRDQDRAGARRSRASGRGDASGRSNPARRRRRRRCPTAWFETKRKDARARHPRAYRRAAETAAIGSGPVNGFSGSGCSLARFCSRSEPWRTGGGGLRVLAVELGEDGAGPILGAEPVQGDAEPQQGVGRLGGVRDARSRRSGTARPPRGSGCAGDRSRRARRWPPAPACRADWTAGSGGSPSRPARTASA